MAKITKEASDGAGSVGPKPASAKLTAIKNGNAADLLRATAADMIALAGHEKFNGIPADVSDEVTAACEAFLVLKERIEAA